MKKSNKIFIGTSIDGYIADKDGGLAWLDSVPNPDQHDMGYYTFMDQIDALLMGRVTFETVCAFDVDWPYTKPVYVLSNTLKEVPKEYIGKVELVKGSLSEVLETIHAKGHYQLYIDGGTCIQSFLKEDLIDEMIITVIPILLGGGASLFGTLANPLEFDHLRSEVYLGQLAMNHYKRKAKN